ncbi:sigma factor-like helix-turn-helix DNA-binding protein [Caulobacter endophyticus]|uniref:sigma factor-like helix-turn-helix DNA-binding protein n=1 Tax=Caulobacter endophyticus TaxID=2172652 RepID=UPI002680068B
MAGDDAASVLELDDLRRALANLALEQRETLILAGAGGLSYDEAAQITGVVMGTVKSRVSRARASLARALTEERLEARSSRAGSAMALILQEVEHIR